MDPLFRDLPQGAEAEDLEAAAVGEDGTVPVHEPVQSPVLPDQIVARPQVEMVGVAQDDLRAGLLEPAPGVMALTVPWVPTGMKTGVRTSPWAVVIRPRRAFDFGSVFSKSNLNAITTQSDSGLGNPDSGSKRKNPFFIRKPES